MTDKIIYRRNNHGNPCYWYALPLTENTYCIHHGLVGGKDILTTVCTNRKSVDEVKSKYNEKLKQGYKYLNELRDDTSCPPVEEHSLLQYLQYIFRMIVLLLMELCFLCLLKYIMITYLIR